MCPERSVVSASTVRLAPAVAVLFVGMGLWACEPPLAELPPGTSAASIGPLTIPAGQERTVCVNLRLANEHPILATQISSTLAPGSHHLILYRSTAQTESLTPTTCQAFGSILGGENVPVYITQQLEDDFSLPGGTGLMLEAHQMVRLEAHYLNASPGSLEARARVLIAGKSLVTGEAAGLVEANLAFWGTARIDIPPNSSFDTGVQFQAALPGTTGVALTTHQHRLGTRFQIWASAAPGDTTAAPVADSQDWSDPPLYRLSPAPQFDGTSGLSYRCQWHNPTPQQVHFGESALDEMCFLWMYYYPSHGFDACIDGTCINRS